MGTTKIMDLMDTWIPWSEECEKIPYTTEKKGIGNGEMRIGFISGASPNGQNEPFDFDIPNYGKYDVKQLDKYTFNTGRDGRDALRRVKAKIIGILSLVDAPNVLAEISPDEISKKNVANIKRYLNQLNDYKKSLYKQLFVHQMYDPVTGASNDCNSFEFYKALSVTRTPDEIIEIMGLESYTVAKKLDDLSHPYIDSPEQMTIDLNNIAGEIFNDIGLIFVDEKNGYHIMKNPAPNLEFERITRGSPRFRVRFQTSLRDEQKSDTAQHCQSAGTSTTPTL
jgi:hypothetical protein